MEVNEIIREKLNQIETHTRDIKHLIDIQPEPNKEISFQDEKMTVAKAAEFADCSYKYMCQLIHNGDIRHWGTGRKRFLLKSELIDDLKNLK